MLSRCERQREAVCAVLAGRAGLRSAGSQAESGGGVCFVALLFRLRDLLVRLGKLM